jgi:predicted GNAT family acetyltransferase
VDIADLGHPEHEDRHRDDLDGVRGRGNIGRGAVTVRFPRDSEPVSGPFGWVTKSLDRSRSVGRHLVMDVTLHPGPASLLATAEVYLRAERFSASVLAVVARQEADSEPVGEPGALWATVRDDSEVVGAAMQTPPWNLFLARMPPPAAAALADAVADTGRVLPGVTGEAATVDAFAARWRQRTGRDSQVRVRERLYVLAELVTPTGVPGEHTRATAADLDLVAAWAEAFHDEAQPDAPIGDWQGWARRRIDAGQVHLWRVGQEAAAMAAVSAPASGVSRVGPVYTEPAHRRRGFGAALTAAATAAAIAEGAEDVVLYTDLANATSNAIYQSIGYRPDHDADERAFV